MKRGFESNYIVFGNGLNLLYVPNQLVVFGSSRFDREFVEPILDAGSLEFVRDLFLWDSVDLELTAELLSYNRFSFLQPFLNRYYDFDVYSVFVDKDDLDPLIDYCFSGQIDLARLRSIAIYRDVVDRVIEF